MGFGFRSKALRPTADGADIAAKARALGFDAVGFAPAALGPEVRDRLRDFLMAGQHGDMGWLAERVDARSHPQVLWPAARTVIALGLSYAPTEDASVPTDRGNISVYARNRDYHDLMKGKLKHLGQYVVARHRAEVKVFVDTAPVMEKPLAQRAGLGWQGKHTNLVSREHGSWLFLGEIYTTLELPPAAPHVDRCGTCARCLTACPTDAFPAPYRLDATRCLAYLTIEHSGPIPEEFRAPMGNRIYGCDDCLAVCPWNRFAQASRHAQLRRGRTSWRRPSGHWRRWTMPGSAQGSRDRRSNASGATDSCAMWRSRSAIPMIGRCSRRLRNWRPTAMALSPKPRPGQSPGCTLKGPHETH